MPCFNQVAKKNITQGLFIKESTEFRKGKKGWLLSGVKSLLHPAFKWKRRKQLYELIKKILLWREPPDRDYIPFDLGTEPVCD